MQTYHALFEQRAPFETNIGSPACHVFGPTKSFIGNHCPVPEMVHQQEPFAWAFIRTMSITKQVHKTNKKTINKITSAKMPFLHLID